MKIYRSIICMIIIIITLCTLCTAFNGFKSMGGIHYTAQLNSLFEWLPIFVIISFFVGFLPVYIHECIKEMQPAKQPANNSEKYQEFQPNFFVGQTFTSTGSNCTLRVKKIKSKLPPPPPAGWEQNLVY